LAGHEIEQNRGVGKAIFVPVGDLLWGFDLDDFASYLRLLRLFYRGKAGSGAGWGPPELFVVASSVDASLFVHALEALLL